MGSYKKPDNEVTPFALYYRKYREAKKEGKVFKRGRPRKPDSECSQNPHAIYMRNYMRKRADKLKELENKANES